MASLHWSSPTVRSNHYISPLSSNRSTVRESATISVILEDGEQYKTLDAVTRIIDVLLENRHDRRTTVIALGGGVVGDIGGFRRQRLPAWCQFHPDTHNTAIAG